MEKINLTEKEIEEIIKLYSSKEISSTHDLAKKFNVGHKRISQILKENNIDINKRGKQATIINYDSSDYLKNFKETDEKTFIVVCKKTGKIFNDYLNLSGSLTNYLLSNNITDNIPKNSFQRKRYFEKNGKYWFEEFFDIKEIDKPKTKKCPYCKWETIDVENNSGWFEQHLKKEHQISKKDYIKEYPEEREYFRLSNKTLDVDLETDNKKFVTCSICGKKLIRIDWKHLNKHNITLQEYKNTYTTKTVSEEYLNKIIKRLSIYNENGSTISYVSKGEKEISNWLKTNNIKCETNNRKILNGKELDILLPDLNIAIEYNGNKWHTEDFGKKDKNYHLNKTLACEYKGIKLIQIFEDEYLLKKNIVLNKIAHLLHFNNKPKIFARNCIIKEIYHQETEIFLEKNHIQGSGQYSVSLGAFYNNNLVSVMTFKKINNNGDYDLTRFATDNNYIITGIGGKLFCYFVKKYIPSSVISFADRRWTIDPNENLYTKLGFKLDEILKPDYKYYNSKIDKYKRFHKFGFRKEKLHKKYNLPLTMTEKEMTKELGYDRIWDCGLFKYKWEKL